MGQLTCTLSTNSPLMELSEPETIDVPTVVELEATVVAKPVTAYMSAPICATAGPTVIGPPTGPFASDHCTT